MRPIKRKQLSQKVAERLNLSVETVDEIVQCYFNYVQKSLSNLEHPHITVNYLGTFFLKREPLERKLEMYEKALAKYEAIEEPNLSQFKSIKDMKHHIEKYKNAIRMLDEMNFKDLKKKEEKQLYKIKKNESDKTMEGEE